MSDDSTAEVSEELEVVYLGKLSVLQLVGVMVACTEFGIRYIVPNTETVLGTFFQDLGNRYIIPNTVFRY